MLVELRREIDARTREISSSQANWPCRRGCDECCRRIAELPRLTREEWNVVEDGLALLPGHLQFEVIERIRKLNASAGHHICPFLDRETGSCLIYDRRPVACRTYGFYVERDRGLYCRQIEERVSSGEFADVVWGNVAGIDARLEALGPRISLPEWFNDSPGWLPRRLPTPPSEPQDPSGER